MIFNKIIQALEEIIYHFILWIILLPKTFYKVLFFPKWINGYLESELLKETDEQFNEYLSPILFWIIIALLPFVIAFSRSEEIVENIVNLGKIDHVYTFFILILIVPILTFAVWVQIFKKLKFNRRELRLQIYTQFYAFSPFELFFTILLVLSTRYNPTLIGSIIFVFFICWYIYQYILMRVILNSKIIKTLLFLLIANACTVLLLWGIVLIMNSATV